MNEMKLSYVFLGLSMTSSWGNGHATTYRALIRELVTRGHDVLFLERDLPFYAANRDLPEPPYGKTRLYSSLDELRERFGREIREADMVIIGSYVPEGIAVGEWVRTSRRGPVAFYDIDTPVTLSTLDAGTNEYISRELLPRYDLYLSFTGGPALELLEKKHDARRASALYCGVDPELYRPIEAPPRYTLGYLGTYSEDRQASLERFLFDVAEERMNERFIVAGPQYPSRIEWPDNVDRRVHLPPKDHPQFYGNQRYTLNLTRLAMRRLGYSPSVRLFEAAACGTPVVSDRWEGIEDFFEPGSEILLVDDTKDVLHVLEQVSEEERLSIGRRARARVLREHTSSQRAATLDMLTRRLLSEPGDK